MGNSDSTAEITPKKHPLNEALEKNKWKKGQSGNPEGRPPGSVSIVEGIKRKLLEIEPENKKTYLELFLSRYFRKAIKDGDVQLMKDFIDRVDGKSLQKVDMSTLGEKINNVIVLPEQELNDKRDELNVSAGGGKTGND